MDCYTRLLICMWSLLMPAVAVQELYNATVCVNQQANIPLTSDIRCPEGYLIIVNKAEYWMLNYTLCGTNVCPCEHSSCSVDVETADRASYRDIINQCEYKSHCENETFTPMNSYPCPAAQLLMLEYECVSDPGFPTTTKSSGPTKSSVTKEPTDPSPATDTGESPSGTPSSTQDGDVQQTLNPCVGNDLQAALTAVSVLAGLLCAAVITLAVLLNAF